MKALAKKIRERFVRKHSKEMVPGDHPNFWMYQ